MVTLSGSATVWAESGPEAVELAPVAQEAGGEEAVLPAAAAESAFNPTGDVALHTLDNGMRVWLKPWPGSDVVHVGMGVAVGGAQDPLEKEGLAHYLEHVLFTAVPGQTEAGFKQEVTSRGGRRNGSTSGQITHYWLEVPAEHGLFAVDWMYRLLFNKSFDEENIRNQLDPILLEGEKKMTPKEPWDYFWEWFVDPDWVGRESFSEYELGIEHESRKVLGTWESLHRIEPVDIEAFYDQYYGPQNMVLGIVGDFESAEVLEEIQQRFGAESRSGEVGTHRKEATSRTGFRRYHDWEDRQDGVYKLVIKLPNIEVEDADKVWLLQAMLQAELQDQLRNMEDKAVYTVRVSTDNRWGTQLLEIETNCKSDRLEKVAGVVHQVLDRLALGEDEAFFERLRLRALAWHRGFVQRPFDVGLSTSLPRHVYSEYERTFTDVIGDTEGATNAELSEWMQQSIRRDQMVEYVTFPLPIPLELLFLVGAMLFGGSIWLARRLMISAVELRRLRYLRKIRFPIAQWVLLYVAWFMLTAFGSNLYEFVLGD
ncbi:MAG: pitrilysin family protein, partial [Myxococcota bacterium]|nr:pitrilysin family protein [Myxococcota bacterium]